LKLAFADGHHEASYPCGRCENRRMLSGYTMSAHLAKKRFMSNYLSWHQHGEVRPAVADESNENDDVDQMDDMVADIGSGCDLESEDPPSEVQNFYRLIATSEENVHDSTDMTMLQAMTHLMGFKSKYSFSNQYCNDIVKFVIDLILAKYNMLKDLYQFKKIVDGFRMDYEKIDSCKKIACCFGRSIRMTPNI
jgi:hypothetical protein